MGLCDLALLTEAAAELGVAEEDLRIFPMYLALLPFEDWAQRKFPTAVKTAQAIRLSFSRLRPLSASTSRETFLSIENSVRRLTVVETSVETRDDRACAGKPT